LATPQIQSLAASRPATVTTCQRGSSRAATVRAAASSSNEANTQPPVPVRRASA